MAPGWRMSLSLAFLVGCTHSATQREPAGKTVGGSELIYATYNQKDEAKIEAAFDQEKWTRASSGERFDLLMKMFYANTRNESRSGKKHAGCFKGDTGPVASWLQGFQHSQAQQQLVIKSVGATTDQQSLVLDITYANNTEPKSARFAIPNCESGKRAIIETDSPREPSSERPVGAGAAPEKAVVASGNMADIYPTNDVVLAESEKTIKKLGLPKFELKADYPRAMAVKEELPWRNQNFDLNDPKDAIVFALMLQKYVYEGMANQNPKNPDQNFIASNSKRYWCHMPGLNFGLTGRDAVHGLTKEFNLGPSPTMSLYKNPQPGTDWGMAIYNFKGCQTIGKVVDRLKKDSSMDTSNFLFEDGSVSAKILFTQSPDKAFEKAFVWQGHISGVGENFRFIQPVRHIQMDIAVRDTTLKGLNPDLNHWVMLTYYFDPTYDYKKFAKETTGEANPLESLKGLPAGFLKMRPMGIQTGLGAPEKVTDPQVKKLATLVGESVIFAGAETNGFEGRLNGPADNPKSACLSCHATAGTAVRMSPGMMHNQEFFPHKASALDFSQQLNFLRRNVETYIGPVRSN